MECARMKRMLVPAHMIADVIIMVCVKQNVEKPLKIVQMIANLHPVTMMVFANLKMARIRLIAPVIALHHPNAIIMECVMQENIGPLAAIVLPVQPPHLNITM
jgi:hypothetical protein